MRVNEAFTPLPTSMKKLNHSNAQIQPTIGRMLRNALRLLTIPHTDN